MSTDKTRLARNFASLLILRGSEFAIPLITIPYILRTVGVANYGLISFGLAFALYFGSVVQYGFGVTATRDIARLRDCQNEIQRQFSVTFTASSLLALVAIVLAIVIVFSIPQLRNQATLHMLSLVQVVFQSIFPIWFFQGMERMAYITNLSFVAKLFYLTGLFLFVKTPDDYVIVPMLNAASAVLIFFCSLVIISRKFGIKLEWSSFNSVSEVLRKGRYAFINQLAPNLYNNSTTFLLGLVAAPYAVGVYSAATKVVDAVTSLAYIVSNTFLPFLSRSIKHHGLFKKIMLALGVLGTALLYITAEFIGRILHPEGGAEIAELLKYGSPSILAIFTMLTFGTNYLMLRSREATAARVTLYTSLLFFILALYLVPAYGIIGCLLTLVGARVAMAIVFYINYKRLQRATT